MKGPNINAIREAAEASAGRLGTEPALKRGLSEELMQALERGVFSKILKTNSRMFFRSVLPTLQSPSHRFDGKFGEQAKRVRYTDRLIMVGSTLVDMDHAVRFYVNQNFPSTLDHEPLHVLMAQSFCFHLARAVAGAKKQGNNNIQANCQRELEVVRNLDVYKKLEEKPSENIFSKGLASRSGTSAALLYLACFGLTCVLRPSFGNEFEEMTAVHYLRYMQVQGYLTRRAMLMYAWPPPRGPRMTILLCSI